MGKSTWKKNRNIKWRNYKQLSSYSLNETPCDYYLFKSLQNFMNRKEFKRYKQVNIDFPDYFIGC